MATVPRSAEAERHDHLLVELLGQIAAYNPNLDAEQIRAAFDYACDHHAGQVRKSGEAFIHHPCAVAEICAELKLDSATITAALLHDTVEDTEAEIEDVRARFGDDVALLVDGVTKLTRISFASREQAQVENYRKMIVAMAHDLRVVLIKLADRLHNMRTISALGKQKQVQTARETLEIYAPLAHRLGIHSIKWELEDLAFACLHPRRYAEIGAMVSQTRTERERFAGEAGTILLHELEEAGITADIAGRAKHLYSIYTKMAQGGKEFNEIYDLTAIRVLVDSVKDCYGAIGIIHSLWKPMPGRFKDYVAMPKFNMYQSLHTTVIGTQGKPLEIQVRTHEMHQTAEYGIAAHWLYKQPSSASGKASANAWVAQLADWQADARDPKEFMDTLRVDLFSDEVYVFTPKGEVKSLPVGSTPLDFAYAVHTDVGHRCVGAKVNGRIVPLHYSPAVGRVRRGADLEAGAGAVARLADAREVVAGAQQDPPVVHPAGARGSRAARARVAAAGAEVKRPAAPEGVLVAAPGRDHPRDGLQEGRRLLRRDRRRQDPGRPGREQADRAAEDRRGRLARGAAHAGPAAAEAARGQLGVRHRRRRGRRSRRARAHGQVLHARSRATRSAATSRSAAASPSTATTAPTCARCGARRSGSRRCTGTTPTSATSSFRVTIALQSWDRPRLLEDVARTFAEHGANIVEYGGHVADQMARNWYTVEVGDVKELRSLLSALRNIDAVFDAYRVTPGG